MPVISVAPNDELLDKLKSNLQEVRARGGELFVFADEGVGLANDDGIRVLHLPPIEDALAPILYTLPLQLLSYHVAVLKGTDVDQPVTWPSPSRWSRPSLVAWPTRHWGFLMQERRVEAPALLFW